MQESAKTTRWSKEEVGGLQLTLLSAHQRPGSKRRGGGL